MNENTITIERAVEILQTTIISSQKENETASGYFHRILDTIESELRKQPTPQPQPPREDGKKTSLEWLETLPKALREEILYYKQEYGQMNEFAVELGYGDTTNTALESVKEAIQSLRTQLSKVEQERDEARLAAAAMSEALRAIMELNRAGLDGLPANEEFDIAKQALSPTLSADLYTKLKAGEEDTKRLSWAIRNFLSFRDIIWNVGQGDSLDFEVKGRQAIDSAISSSNK